MDENIIKSLDIIVDSISVIEENLAGMGFRDYRIDRKRMITVVESFGVILSEIDKRAVAEFFKFPTAPLPGSRQTAARLAG